ncbi:MAG: hypothetical protein JOZ41_05620 [Chloroflexi bacterium]|nr:hypothetical protein [Chloroflexota bacterium]
MDHICFALPILPGKTEDARSFHRELDGPRKADYAASERRIGITREFWFLQPTPQGDMFLAYMESPDFGRALGEFSASQDEFDQWFKRQLADVTGVDLNNPPPGPLSELLSSYEAESQQAPA